MATNAERERQSGFTLMEVMVASAISMIVLGGVVVAFIEGLQVWQQEEIRNELNFDLEKAMERIRVDLRLSSVDTEKRSEHNPQGIGLMSFFPANTTRYSAISIPQSIPTTPGGLLPRDTNTGELAWNQTVIYHVKKGSPDQLLRTVFSPRKPDATREEIYNQLCQVVDIGTTNVDDAALDANEVGTSRVVFKNLVSLWFRPPSADDTEVGVPFDCYAEEVTKKTYTWGSIVLGSTPNPHTLTFKVVGKNADSTGLNFAIDRFRLSASAGPQEAEMVPYTVTAGSADTGYKGPDWSGYRGLTFTPAASGDSITFNVDAKDFWFDGDFGGSKFASNCVVAMEASLFDPPDMIVKMDRGTAWTASSIGSNVAPVKYSTTTTVTNFLYGGSNDPNSTITKNGCWARLHFSRGVGFSTVFTNVQILAEGGGSANVTFNNGQPGVYLPYNGAATTNSDWVSMWEIDRSSNYMVRYETTAAFADEDFDMLVASARTNPSEKPTIHCFMNNGTKIVPNFDVAGIDNWQNLQWGGGHPSMTLADIDADGDLDMFAIAETGIMFYRNTGDTVVAKMSLVAMAGVNGICSCGGGKPTLADLDGDGDLDIVWCHKHTTSVLTVLRNDGNYASPSFVNAGNLTNNVGGTVYLDGRADGRWNSPEFADIDGDGDADLFIGCGTNTIGFWENTTATPTAYQFTFRTNAYAGIRQAGATDYSPKFVDIDADGDLDLFVGNSLGEIWFYPNTGAVSSALWDTNAVAPWRTLPPGRGFAVPVFINLDGEMNAPAQWESDEAGAIPYSTVDGVASRRVVGLERLEVGYPRTALFRSAIFDTKDEAPEYQRLNYNQYEVHEDGGNVQVRVRAGDQSDLSDQDAEADEGWSDWFNGNVDESLSSVPEKRYLQYECMLECGFNNKVDAHTNVPTAMLRDVTIDWTAKEGLVELQADLFKGPDCGIVYATVDGHPFVKSVEIGMEIYQAGRRGTNTASGMLEVKPLNTDR